LDLPLAFPFSSPSCSKGGSADFEIIVEMKLVLWYDGGELYASKNGLVAGLKI